MPTIALPATPAPRRPGMTLVTFALMLPVILGVVGLVIDSALLLAAYRQTQNAADAAALAAAMSKMRGETDSSALASANAYLSNNGFSDVTLTLNAGATDALNIPPQDPGNSGSPYKNTANYVEVLVTQPITTLLIQFVGVNSSQQVTARAVAGFEPVGAGQGAIVLNPQAAPGLDVSANQSNNNFVRLIVNGNVTVNSKGGGVDQFGNTVPTTLNANAVKTKGQTMPVASIVANDLQVVGGVTNLDNIRLYNPSFPPNYYDPNAPDRPVFARMTVAPDPLASLATPSFANGVPQKYWDGSTLPPTSVSGLANLKKGVSVSNNQTVTLQPGVYQSITITGGTVTFQPGIYVLGPTGTGGGNSLSINGGTVNGSGVLFYNTGNDYNPTTGAPDKTDPPDQFNASPPGAVSSKFGGITINGGTGTLSPYNNPNNASDPFNGLLIYQRRYNTVQATIGGSSAPTVSGTFYAKWANFQLAGGGNWNAQFIVGSLSLTGQSTLTINATGKNLGKANLVFLVE